MLNNDAYQCLKPYMTVKVTGNLEMDVSALLAKHQKFETMNHVLKVARLAKETAARIGIDVKCAEAAGLLHDISNIIPVDEMVAVAEKLGFNLLDKERQYPRILHQRLSSAIAATMFNIKDQAILKAIECHTTLRKNPSKMDLVLFVSDKTSWDICYNEPYVMDMIDEIEKGDLENAARIYINHSYEALDGSKMLHPWLIEAHSYLNENN